MPRTRSGQLDRRGTVERPASTGRDDYGQQTSNWSTVGTFWFSLKGTGGEEHNVGQQQQAQVTHELATRYDNDVQATDRITIESTQYHVTRVFDPDGRKRRLSIEAIEQR